MAEGKVVYSRDKDENISEIWDDTALIKAYDEAVSSMKAHMALKTGEDGDQTRVGGTTPERKKKKSRRKHRKKDKTPKPTSTQQIKQWKVGDLCRAVYTEDGQIYEAIILGVDQEEESCTVRYLGYGNEEEQSFTDLLPSKERLSTAGSRTVSECDSMEWSQHGPSPRGIPPPRFGQFPAGSLGRGWSHGLPPNLMAPGPNVMMGDMPVPPMMPPMFPPTMGLGMPPFMGPTGRIPNSMGDMPPPPTIDDEGTLHHDDEALHSMLMSWYMSGYHTGYYQGLKQGKKSKTAKEKSHHDTAQDATESTR